MSREPKTAESTPPQSATSPMQHGHRPASSAQIAATLVPEVGWHFLHLFYRVDRGALAGLSADDRRQGRATDPSARPGRRRRSRPDSMFRRPRPQG